MSPDDFLAFLEAALEPMGYRPERFHRRNIRRRVRSRMETLGIHDLAEYARLVRRDRAEQAALDYLLRLTITRFFRNSWLWSDLESLIMESPAWSGGPGTLRIWSGGCAGGEEPFSMAMLLDDLDASGHLRRPWTILGTDTDAASLKRARGATYKWGAVREVPRRLLDRWFTEDQGLWSLDDGIRTLVTFSEHDLVTEEPPGKFHVVLLRNSILTYNTEPVRRKILGRVQACLREPGILVIGRTESLPEGTGFDQVSRCIYRPA